MYNKIIIIYPREFSKKEYLKNSIFEFKKKGIKVEVWIIKKLITKNEKIYFNKIYNNKVKIKIINSFSQLNYFLKKEKIKTLFDVRVNLNFSTFQFFKNFLINKKDYILFPGLKLFESNIHFLIITKLKNIFLKMLFFLLNIKIKKAKFFYMISKKGDIENNLLISKNSHMIKGHHADYDKYLSCKLKKIKTKKFFLFLDQDIPNHQDLTELKANHIDEKKYYDSIKDFFIKIEKKLKIKYLISPHPRAKIKTLKKYFGNRVSRNDTIQLVNNCEFVICHDSTAVNFAYLLKKPFLSIINNELINNLYPHETFIKKFCRKHNVKLINIHKDNILKKDIKINKKNRKKFIDNFIKFHNSKKSRADLILQAIR